MIITIFFFSETMQARRQWRVTSAKRPNKTVLIHMPPNNLVSIHGRGVGVSAFVGAVGFSNIPQGTREKHLPPVW